MYLPLEMPTHQNTGQNRFVHYANSYGKNKVMFGTDWPVIDPIRAVKEVEDLGFREEAKKLIMRDNALKVFNLN